MHHFPVWRKRGAKFHLWWSHLYRCDGNNNNSDDDDNFDDKDDGHDNNIIISSKVPDRVLQSCHPGGFLQVILTQLSFTVKPLFKTDPVLCGHPLLRRRVAQCILNVSSYILLFKENELVF